MIKTRSSKIICKVQCHQNDPLQTTFPYHLTKAFGENGKLSNSINNCTNVVLIQGLDHCQVPISHSGQIFFQGARRRRLKSPATGDEVDSIRPPWMTKTQDFGQGLSLDTEGNSSLILFLWHVNGLLPL